MSSTANSSAVKVLLDASAAVAWLVRPDGLFREWINLSPIGTSRNVTVLGLSYADRFTGRLFAGDLAFAFEPVHVLGPSLPAAWEIGSPPPRVALPELDADNWAPIVT